VTSVLVVDDEELFRRGLCDWLTSLEGVDLVGQAESSESCLELIKDITPDVALIDIRLPGVSGVTLLEKLKEVSPGIKAIVLSGVNSPELVFNAFEAGASGFLPKQASSDEVSYAIHQVMEGRWYLSPLVTGDVLNAALLVRSSIQEEGQEAEGFVPLTNRERELLKLIAEGHTFTNIAKHLSINSRSVERLKSKLEIKLNADNLVDLIREAIKLGLVEA
jgi:DNA-binding NarL/FixJ family response regulator